MAMFVRRFCHGQAVVAHDIGALGFFNEAARIVDLYGLANTEVTLAKLGGHFNRAVVERLSSSAGARVAMVCPTWLAESGGPPSSWSKVCTWIIPDNVVCKNPQVDIYCLIVAARDELARELNPYKALLPAGVICTWAPFDYRHAASARGSSPLSKKEKAAVAQSFGPIQAPARQDFAMPALPNSAGRHVHHRRRRP